MLQAPEPPAHAIHLMSSDCTQSQDSQATKSTDLFASPSSPSLEGTCYNQWPQAPFASITGAEWPAPTLRMRWRMLQHLMARVREEMGIHARVPGARHRAQTDAERAAVLTAVRVQAAALDWDVGHLVDRLYRRNSEGSCAAPSQESATPGKRKRLSVDKHIVMDSKVVLSDDY